MGGQLGRRSKGGSSCSSRSSRGTSTGLRAAAADERAWTWMTTRDTEAWIRQALEATDMYHFVVVKDGEVIGSTSYLNVLPEHLPAGDRPHLEHPGRLGTGANTEAKYLLLRHAFETLGATASSSRPTRRTTAPARRWPRSPPSSRGSTASTWSSATASAATRPGTP